MKIKNYPSRSSSNPFLSGYNFAPCSNTFFLTTTARWWIPKSSPCAPHCAFFELILAISNYLLYPRLKRYSEIWGFDYSLFRLLEVVFILIGLLNMLTIVTLSKESLSMGVEIKLSAQSIAGFLKQAYILMVREIT